MPRIIIPTNSDSKIESPKILPEKTSPTNTVKTNKSSKSDNSGKLKTRRIKDCQNCNKVRRDKSKHTLCSFHRFKERILSINTTVKTLKEVFIEISYDREFHAINIVNFVGRLLKHKDIYIKDSKFINELCFLSMMGLRGKKKNNSVGFHLTPDIVTQFMLHSDLDFDIYKPYLEKEHLELCINKGFPIKKSILSCYNKKESTEIINVLNIINNRDNKLISLIPLPKYFVTIIIDYLN
jgi:hypothetical protein